MSQYLRWVYFLFISSIVFGQCPNKCTMHGTCTKYSTCKCFEGFGGNDCGRRLCPTGPAFVDIATDTDKAHADTECSGSGDCDYQTGECKCYPGFTGNNCGRMKCFNDCSGHGRCISLRQAAEEYDGYHLNHTTTYSRWDADLITGCICDYGYSGADCSQRSCEYGIDPRLTDQARERVTFACRCSSGGCSGKFKLRLYGSVLDKWLYPSSTVKDMLYLLQTAPGIFANSSRLNLEVVSANRTADSTICVKNGAVRTEISFRRNAGDIPAVSIYGNMIGHGEVFFETKQVLMCDCIQFQCNGTFRLSFDDEMSVSLNAFTSASSVVQAISNLETVRSSGLQVTAAEIASNSPLCANYQARNFTIIFRGLAGNAPRLGLWSSVKYGKDIAYYSTNSTYSPLRLLTYDGRDDHVKLCNGIGTCDFATGVCNCPFGWKFDANVGACGRMDIPTSDWGGLGRCPGVIPGSQLGITGSKRRVSDAIPNYNTRIIVAMDPIPLNDTTRAAGNTYVPDPFSTIRAFDWLPVTVSGPKFDTSSELIIVNLTSSTSAGPIVIDHAYDQIIFVDANPSYPFIGKASLLVSDMNNYTRWYTYDNNAVASTYKKVFALAFDARPWRRVLYWSTPGGIYADDGDIYWAYIDTVGPVVGTLSSLIGATTNTFSPFGMAINYELDRIYWVDRTKTGPVQHGVIRSCSLNMLGEDCWEDQVLDDVGVVDLSANFTDIVIDFVHNSTMYLVDNAANKVRVIAVGLSLPKYFNNITKAENPGVFSQNIFYYSPRMVLNASMIAMDDVRQIILDIDNNMVLLADVDYARVTYGLTEPDPSNTFQLGVAFNGFSPRHHKPRKVINMIFDHGYGPLRRSDILDCYGRGTCMGVAGNFECKCHEGFYGNCLAASCPKGKAWFQEPFVENIAHDIDVECSNAGLCNRESGECTCFEGFEGHACQRRSCIASASVDVNEGGSVSCFNRGRCLSMRDLALYHRDDRLELAPVIYGSQANDPNTWDADVLQGCKADEYGSYFGHYNVTGPRDVDVLHYDCPMGFNTRLFGTTYVNSSGYNDTQSHVFETQRITCKGADGFFRVSFRGEKSTKLNANTTLLELQTTLQAMKKVGLVTITMSADRLCLPHRQVAYTTITFLSHVGKVPLLKVEDLYLQGRKVNAFVERIADSDPNEVYECSGHGNCDHRTGLCHCFPGYASSNGRGEPGTRGDCGFNIIV